MNTTKKPTILLLGGSFAALIIFVSLTVHGHGRSQQAANPETLIEAQAVKLTQNLFLDDERSALSGGQSFLSQKAAMQILHIARTVNAKTLSEDYAANEVAADQKYKTGRLVVSGTVREINKDFLGNPYVTLGGRGSFENVEAEFDKGAETKLASLRKGQSVHVVCDVSAKIVTEVMLDDCSMLDDYLQASRSQSDPYITNALDGKQPVSKDVVQMLRASYIMAKLLPRGSSCFRELDATCLTQFKAAFSKLHSVQKDTLQKEATAFTANLRIQ